jgi:hypothetical protein
MTNLPRQLGQWIRKGSNNYSCGLLRFLLARGETIELKSRAGVSLPGQAANGFSSDERRRFPYHTVRVVEEYPDNAKSRRQDHHETQHQANHPLLATDPTAGFLAWPNLVVRRSLAG